MNYLRTQRKGAKRSELTDQLTLLEQRSDNSELNPSGVLLPGGLFQRTN
jgi:hypothetical protein